MNARALFALLVLGCSAGAPSTDLPARWSIWIDPGAPPAVRRAAEDLAAYFEAMGLSVERPSGAPPDACVPREGHVVFVGEAIAGELPSDTTSAASNQSFRIAETRCDGGSRVALAGGGLLGRQYAAYEYLHRLGVRFFHPEEEHVPAAPWWPREPVAIDHTPAFRWRSVSLHLTHPLELGDAFRDAEQEYFPEAERYIDWQIKNGASRGHGGIGAGELATHGLDRGLLLATGFSLHNTQQGGRPLIDPDDPRTEEEQIAAAIEERMQRADGRTPDVFGFTFNPSEFTEIPDTDAVRQITFIADYLREHYPGTRVETINHGTAGPPTATYGVRFYDLPRFAPPNLGVRVHTLMFYDLFRPAPVYGNRNFNNLYDFMASEHTVRPLTYFPESAWWLTFDNAVPLYLPITVEARDRDLQGIAWMRAGNLDGHHVFGSGHEWGYWQNEHCSFRMAMDLDYRWQDCFADITATMGPAAGETQAVLEELVALQERDFFDERTLAYLVGTDPETEVAASIGVVFHPLPPAPPAILRWDAARIESFLANERASLERMDGDYARLVARLRAIEPSVGERGRPFFAEILDGIEVSGLRARHAWQVYGALVTLRRSELELEPALATEARELLADARRTTAAALAVIARREAGYRYAPLARSIAGGPDGTEDTNWTVYRYRYLNRTHHGYYYTRIDSLAEEAFEGGGGVADVSDALLEPGADLEVVLRAASFADPVVDWGDGSPVETAGPSFTHVYASEGVYPLRITGRLGGDPFELAGDVARLAQEWQTGFSGDITAPANIDLVEAVMPALVLGRIDATRLALGFSAADDGRVELGEWAALTAAASSPALLESEPAQVRVPVVNRATGAISAHLVVDGAVVRLADAASPVVLTGSLDTEAVIAAVVAIGGFDERGARGIVASTLGFTPDTLPASVAFEARYALR